MEKILSQDEIDQLFRAAQGAAADARAPVGSVVKKCDFRQTGQLTKEQVQQVTLLHAAFPANLGNSLGAYLRAGIHVNLVAVEQISYREFVSRLPDQPYVITITLQPAEELAAMQLELPVLFPMIDVLLGGSGRALAEPRDLTEIEEQILESVVALISRELEFAWQEVLAQKFRPGQRQKQAQIITLMSAGERILYLSFEVLLNDIRGLLNLAFPATVSNVLLRKLAMQGMVKRRPSMAGHARLRERLLDCGFGVELQLTHIPLRIGEIVDLQLGHIVSLHHVQHDAMSFSVNGRAIFSGVPVSCGAFRGALLQEKVATSNVSTGDQL
ncbi:MAG: flagellar motor switch protein FliM [Candidatus Acidiferrales bacterium]